MKIKKLLPIVFLPITPIVFLSSCNSTTSDSPIKIKETVFQTKKEKPFNDMFNLLSEQNNSESFSQIDVEKINLAIANEIQRSKPIQEKLKIYFFISIFEALNNVSDIKDGKVQNVEAIGSRKSAVDAIKRLIDESAQEKNNYQLLENEINKITDIKIILDAKVANEVPTNWTWELEFKLTEDSKIAQILQGDSVQNKRGVFYKRIISEAEKNKAEAEATKISGKPINDPLWKIEYDKILLQLEYQSSKLYWDNETKIVKSIKLESNVNPYFKDGTSGGFTSEDATRTIFAIDFIQNPNNFALFKPVFLFQTSSVISSGYINVEWRNFLKYKRYQTNDDGKVDKQKVKDIVIDLKVSSVKYNKNVLK